MSDKHRENDASNDVGKDKPAPIDSTVDGGGADASQPLPVDGGIGDQPAPEPVKGPAPITLESGPAPVVTDASPPLEVKDDTSGAPGFSIQLLPDGGKGIPGPGDPALKLPEPFAAVEGFKPGTDKIDFSLIDANAKVDGVQDFVFDGDLKAAPAAGHFGVTHSGDDVLVAFNDGSAAEPSVLALLDLPDTNLTATDFVL